VNVAVRQLKVLHTSFSTVINFSP